MPSKSNCRPVYDICEGRSDQASSRHCQSLSCPRAWSVAIVIPVAPNRHLDLGMSREHPKLIGLVKCPNFSLLGLNIELIGYPTGCPVPIAAFAGTYPISLVLLSIYPPLISNRVRSTGNEGDQSHGWLELCSMPMGAGA